MQYDGRFELEWPLFKQQHCILLLDAAFHAIPVAQVQPHVEPHLTSNLKATLRK